MISYGQQSIDKSDIREVIKILESDYLTQGPKIELFEKAIAEYCGVKYCVVVSNGTAALQLAVASLNIQKGLDGITSPNTFVASSNSLLYNNIKPIFADIDQRTYNITYQTIQKCLTKNTRVIIPVHFAGQPCQMREICELAKENNLYIIEDAAHAIGSSYENGKPIGSCLYSDLTTFSFHPVKTITSGEGGAITTNNKDLYEKLLLLRNHGITKNDKMMNENPGPWYYEMQMLGYNYRMTELQAALGINQLKKLDSFKYRRRELVEKYNRSFSNINNIIPPFESDKMRSCFHLYVIRINFENLDINRKELMEKLFSKGIGTQVHYIPVNSQPYYTENFGTSINDTPNAKKYYEEALSLPLYPNLSDVEQDFIIKTLLEFIGEGVE